MNYRKGFTGVLIFELSLEGVSHMAKDHRSHSYSLYNSLYLSRILGKTVKMLVYNLNPLMTTASTVTFMDMYVHSLI